MMDRSLSTLILVVEDEPTLRQDIVEELQEAGYRTLAAQDGAVARNLLADVAPDLVLCDITMPHLDGYDLLAALRGEYPHLAATPFVFLTAMSEPQEVITGKIRGADDYLVKPVEYDLLLATVASRLRQVARIRGQHETEVARMRAALAGMTGSGPEQALDLIALGVVLLDHDGKVQYSNRTARDMARAADHVTMQRTMLQATDPLSDKALQTAITESIYDATAENDAIRGVLLQGEETAISALICTLEDTAQACVALFLSTSNQLKTVSKQVLIDLFGLTPTEARVAAILTRGVRPAEAAEELGVSQTTISFHMRNLFQKTGTNRQADLVALILAGPMSVTQPAEEITESFERDREERDLSL